MELGEELGSKIRFLSPVDSWKACFSVAISIFSKYQKSHVLIQIFLGFLSYMYPTHEHQPYSKIFNHDLGMKYSSKCILYLD